MSTLNTCTVRISGLALGIHRYAFTLGEDFFNRLGSDLIEKGQFKVDVELDKKPDLFVMNIQVAGFMETPCDRCLKQIPLPVEGNQDYIIKYKSSFETHDQDDYLWLEDDVQELDISPMINETISLSIPLIKIYNCEDAEPKPCDQEVLKRLNNQEQAYYDNPIWDALKEIKK